MVRCEPWLKVHVNISTRTNSQAVCVVSQILRITHIEIERDEDEVEN